MGGANGKADAKVLDIKDPENKIGQKLRSLTETPTKKH